MHKNYKHKYFVIGLYDGGKQYGDEEVSGRKLKHVFKKSLFSTMCGEDG